MKKVLLSLAVLLVATAAFDAQALKRKPVTGAPTTTVTTTPPQGSGQQQSAAMDAATRQALTDAVNAMKAVRTAAQAQGAAIAAQVSSELKAAA